MDGKCPICDRNFGTEKTVRVQEKGLVNVVKFSVQRKDGAALREKLKGVKEAVMHEECRKNYTRRMAANENAYVSTPPPKPLLRSVGDQNFNYRKACFLCGREVPLLRTGLPRTDRGVSIVTKDTMRESILDACEGRTEEWTRKAAIRTSAVPSLTNSGACYHRSCYAAIVDPARSEPSLTSPPGTSPCTATPSPATPTPGKKASKRQATSPAEGTPTRIPAPRLAIGRGRGRPKDSSKMEAFAELCRQVKKMDEWFTLAELIALVPASSRTMYTDQYACRLLKDEFKEKLLVVERPGKSPLLCYRGERFDQLGEEWYAARNANEEQDKLRVVIKAGDIVRSDIDALTYEPEYFPTVPQIKEGGASIVPNSLLQLLRNIIMRRKTGSGIDKASRLCNVIAHAIISAARPKSYFSPLHLGVGVWVHRKIGSKTLIDILHRLGSSCSYAMIQEFEKAVVISSNFDIDPLSYVQFAFDNFDFDIATPTGHDTFHSMGGMQYVTPKEGLPPRGPIPRLGQVEKGILLAKYGVIPLKIYSKPPQPGFSKMTVMDLRPGVVKLSPDEVARVSKARNLDVMWLVGTSGLPKHIPAWNGFMSCIMQNSRPYTLSATMPLPFVNLDPSDPSTIYTSLMFAADQGKKQGQQAVPVTFDQPLFWKAAEIILASPEDSPLRSIIPRLGGFHLLMSVMGSVGKFMMGSGIEDLWVTVYAKNSIPQVMSGKAYSRAVRAHFFTQTVLLELVLEHVFQNLTNAHLRKTAIELCLKVYRGNEEAAVAEGSQTMLAISQGLEEALNNLAASSRTGRLWVQYIRQVEIMRMLIRAERLGDWTLHLYAVKQFLPYFHAAGHLNYAKTAHLYAQLMASLESKMTSSETAKFCDQGFFTVRKTDRTWSGNFSDQTIEMSLMRPMKSIGGITMHGRGITESTLAVWVRTMPHCSEIIDVFEDYCGIFSGSSEQHVELRDSSISRDASHLDLFRKYIEQHNPFEKPSDQLVCISSGLVADETINCDQALEIGCRAMEKMAGKLFSELTLHRKDMVVPISAMTRSVTVKGNAVQVNPTQLFHRIIVATKDISELEAHYEYELAPFPTSLLHENGMRKTDKSAMVEALEKLHVPADDKLPANPVYVVDGGFLLRKVVWPRMASYADVLDLYVKYVTSNYGATAVVVFDGYANGPSIKDQEHNLRAATGTSPDLEFQPEMTISTTQTKFLTNGKNKDRFIQMLAVSLEKAGISTLKAPADADRLVVVHAIELAQSGKNCVVVGTDTDLLVLLVGLSPSDVSLHFMIPPTGRTSRKVHHITEIQASMGKSAPNILLAHAFSGCDTVSAMFRGSKKKALQKLCQPALKEEAEKFLQKDSTPDQIAAAGEKFFLSLYGCPKLATLGKARFFLYKRTIARQSVKAKFELASLPATSEAARQHSFRAYLQVQEWLGNELPPTDWGWQLRSGQLHPITTTQPPAPHSLLDLISCNCKGGCERGCGCANAMLKCSSICGHCAGVGCANAETPVLTADDAAAQDMPEDAQEDAEEDPDDPDEIDQ